MNATIFRARPDDASTKKVDFLLTRVHFRGGRPCNYTVRVLTAASQAKRLNLLGKKGQLLRCTSLARNPYYIYHALEHNRNPRGGVPHAHGRCGNRFFSAGAGGLHACRRNAAAAAVQRSLLAPTTTNFTTRARRSRPACAIRGAPAPRENLPHPSGTPTTTATAPLARSPLQWFK